MRSGNIRRLLATTGITLATLVGGALTAQATDRALPWDQLADTTASAVDLHGFLLSGGTRTTIDVPGATETVVIGINDRGRLAGHTLDIPALTGSGFVFDRGVFTVTNVPGAQVTGFNKVNNRGQIVGSYTG